MLARCVLRSDALRIPPVLHFFQPHSRPSPTRHRDGQSLCLPPANGRQWIIPSCRIARTWPYPTAQWRGLSDDSTLKSSAFARTQGRSARSPWLRGPSGAACFEAPLQEGCECACPLPWPLLLRPFPPPCLRKRTGTPRVPIVRKAWELTAEIVAPFRHTRFFFLWRSWIAADTGALFVECIDWSTFPLQSTSPCVLRWLVSVSSAPGISSEPAAHCRHSVAVASSPGDGIGILHLRTRCRRVRCRSFTLVGASVSRRGSRVSQAWMASVTRLRVVVCLCGCFVGIDELRR